MHPHEYEWVKQTRRTLLDFCSEIKPEDFTRRIDGFGDLCMRDMLMHMADCYHAWLGSYLLLRTKKPITAKDALAQIGPEEIRERFAQADAYVKDVLTEFAGQMEVPLTRDIPWRVAQTLTLTPGKLLMHTVTHEYHHKGQIMSMARFMGYTPPNTDVLGTDD
ncbi:DinB family protein [Brevibacillus fluminis]|uniref:DinB family protein n=1 Tax=Brevibacillus fluminis TaxID=511487 RepID=UPI003F8C55D2